MLQKLSLPLISDAGRTALATSLSYLVARVAGLPEAYWAPIISAVVIQSSLGAALQISLERMIGTLLGAALGGLLATFFPPTWWIFGLGVLVLGVICGAINFPNSYRFSVITLSIVVLVPRIYPAWRISLHRTVEVAIGIAVALAVTALWQDGPAPATGETVAR